MPFDVFISYSSKDKNTADAACAKLEATGIRCWIAPRDIRPGLEYASGIIAGIDACRVMVLILSSNANASPQVHREIERAVSKGLTIIPLRIEDIAPTQAMEYYLGSIHWLDALTPPLAQHLQQLIETVKANLQVDSAARQTAVDPALNEQPIAAVREMAPSGSPALTAAVATRADGHVDGRPSPRPAKMLWGIAAIAIVAAVAAVGWSVSHGPFLTVPTIKPVPGPNDTPAAPVQQSTACTDILCETNWTYSDSTINPPKSLGFAQGHIAIVGGAKGTYSLNGNSLYIEVNNKYAEYHATLDGAHMSGYASNVNKLSWTWSATKK